MIATRLIKFLTLCLVVWAGPALADSQFGLGKVTITTKTGAVHHFSSEIADTPQLQAQGYMYRTNIPQMTGMLFVFDNVDHRSFWMRNTPTSLDIIFVREDGSIAHIVKNAAPLNDTPLPSTAPVKLVFEVIAGTSDRLKIAPGDSLTFIRE